MTHAHAHARTTTILTTVLGATLCLGLTACAGSAGGAAAAGGGGGGEGVAWGAAPEEYAAALADMEPVTLVYQAGGQGPTGFTGEAELAFEASVEEWSGGKIDLEIVWGQAIAPFDEVTEATADGRIDLGVEIPIYSPSKYPAINDLINLSPTGAASPYFEEMVTTAALLDVAWNTPEILESYEEKGATVYTPTMFEFSNALMCTEPGGSLAELGGRQMRVGSEADHVLAGTLGGSPVSMQFVEAFEALQRNTIDCTFGGLKIGADNGFLTVAPYAVIPTDHAFVRNPTALVASPKVTSLPLAAQQLLWDLRAEAFANTIESNIKFNGQAMGIIEEKGGDVVRLEPDAEAALATAVEDLRGQVESSDAVDGAAMIANVEDALEKYRGIAEDLGYVHYEDYFEFAEAYEAEPFEVDEFANAVFEEVMLERRPS
ncbi:C4-dicarboxylate ABC transporter substrate-binding protein [Brevibacterium samyangense]|uniref:TRAP-type C4-dicarboxylate transport system, substrate-binding protein n=1 Tax=Brevibacterium samyangense TaxID=366888 RepID=A0ABP5EU09_9MICO